MKAWNGSGRWLVLAVASALWTWGCGGGGGGPGDGGDPPGDAEAPLDGGPGGDDGGPGGDDGGPGGDDGGPGGDDGGVPTDAGTPECTPAELSPGDPIEATAGEWTFVEFSDAYCMNGSNAGIGVNLAPESDKVMIFLQGGGACFEWLSCLGTADSFGAGSFSTWADGRGGRGIFDREDAANPVADWNMVFVPYCTGDVHAGNNPEGPSDRMHVGFANMTEFLERLVPTFDGPSQVLLTGSSAGGFGAAYNWDQVQRAFGCDTPVYVVDDSGPPMSDSYLKPCLQQQWRDTWGLDDTLPADCPECSLDDGGGIVNFPIYLAEKYPERFGLLSTMEDSVIRGFFGYGYTPSCERAGNMPADEFRAGLNELRDDILAPYPHFKTFYVEGDSHTFLGQPLGDNSAGGVTLAEWIRRLLEDDAAWDHRGP